MMRRIVLLLLAVLAAGGTFAAVRRTPAPAPAAMVVASAAPRILVAALDLPAGRLVRADDFKWQAWPLEGLPDGAVREGEKDASSFTGAVVRSHVMAGEPILDARFARPGDRGFMAAVLAPGRRAVSVPLTATSGNAGFVLPGDRVDLIVTVAVKSDDGRPTTRAIDRRASETLLRNLRVLAVDQRVDGENKEAVVGKTATLEVTPKEAEIILLAEEIGKIALSLRGLVEDDADDSTSLPPSHTWETEALPPQPSKPIVRDQTHIRIVRGAAVKEVDLGGAEK
jgi:pilus assembly protein CpaB